MRLIDGQSLLASFACGSQIAAIKRCKTICQR
jgi:hypothetical protein